MRVKVLKVSRGRPGGSLVRRTESLQKLKKQVVEMAYEYPAYGQMRASNELRKQGIPVSSGGVRSIWIRHGLEMFKKRLKALEEKL